MKTEKEKMLAGEMYDSLDHELLEARKHAKKTWREYNKTFEETGKYNRSLFRELFGNVGKKFFIETSIKFDYGFNIYIGENFYANYDCILLDICKIQIGKNCMFGPRVTIYTATHPINAVERNSGLEYGKAVTIRDNVWIGGDATICPGVTIGNNVVVAAGAVVTKDIPDNTVVGGNPAKIIKKIV